MKELQKASRITSCENKDISESEYKKILKLYKEALSSNLLDKEQGLDGSTWCIEVEPGGNFEKKFCFWTPSFEPKKRHLEGVYNLGNYLWKFSGLVDSREFELY